MGGRRGLVAAQHHQNILVGKSVYFTCYHLRIFEFCRYKVDKVSTNRNDMFEALVKPGNIACEPLLFLSVSLALMYD